MVTPAAAAPTPAVDRGELEQPGAPTSMTPKRKPLMISTPLSSGTTPKDAKSNKQVPSSSSKQPKAGSSWPFVPAPNGEEPPHPGVSSPSFQDRSMQPPHHRSRDYPHNSQSSEKPPRQSIHRDATAASGNDPSNYPESMEEEEMGADYLSLSLPVGSFAEDSPPRRKPEDNSKSKRSPRPSPPSSYPPPYGYAPPHPHAHHHQHPPPPYYTSKSPRSQSYAASMYYGAPHSKGPRRGDGPPPPPPPHYAYPPPPSHLSGYRYYPPPFPPADPWTSPQAYESEFDGKENEDNINKLKHTFRASPPQGSPGRRSSSPPPIEDDEQDGSGGDKTKNTTPEKVKMRSPFRSPPLSQTKKSPMFRSPGLGNYGSFGMMDTPGGTLAAEFSPMGPILGKDPFGTGYPTPPQLSLSRSSSEDNMEDATEKNPDLATSPFSGFLQNDFPPFPPKNNAPPVVAPAGGLRGVTRSPLLSEKRAAKVSEPQSASTQLASSSKPSSSRTHHPGAKILASPLGPTSGTKPRKLWNGPSDSGPMRLELGGTNSLKKSLEGINSMMRGNHPPPPPMATPSTTHSSRTPYSRLPPHTNYRRLNTPIKLEPSPVQTSKPTSALSNKRGLSSSTKSTREAKITRTSAGKENLTTPAQVKRNPCNCKKSRCLKLYCECFASELFCEGCNCTDCQNSQAFSGIRDKAIKDTRAKNPNAFKPRFSAKGNAIAGASPQSGHNMGCRCKRSECLKKYCECFQAGVMCGSKCKCSDCANFAGSQKLIDKRRKIKDQRGAELAMKVAEQAWKRPQQHHQHSAGKLPLARPPAHGLMPSPLGTPSSRMPHGIPPHMHTSPHFMRPGYPPHATPWGFSPMHVSPSAYGMHPYHPPPPPHSASSLPPSMAAKKTTPPSAGKRKAEMMPYAKAIASSKNKEESPGGNTKTPVVKTEPTDTNSEEGDKAAGASPPASKIQPTPSEKPDNSVVQPTPLETKTKAGALITPSPAGRLFIKTKKKRMEALGGGNLPKIPRSDALAVLSYLSDKDKTSAIVVSKRWGELVKALKNLKD